MFNSIKNLNTVINTFMELEKVRLSKTKCHKSHTGKKNMECPILKVHGADMEENRAEKI